MSFTMADVSHHNTDNGPIDWSKYPFPVVAIKATDWINGAGWIDPQFATNRAKTNGLELRLFYHYLQDADPIAQAEFFARVIGKLAANERVILDMEDPSIEQAKWSDYWQKFSTTVNQKLAVRMGTYTGDEKALWLPSDADNCLLWLARYPNQPVNSYDIWQYTDAGSCGGITGPVDLSKSEMSVADVIHFLSVDKPATVNDEDEMIKFVRLSTSGRIYRVVVGAGTAYHLPNQAAFTQALQDLQDANAAGANIKYSSSLQKVADSYISAYAEIG